jgi:hypothetical protein
MFFLGEASIHLEISCYALYENMLYITGNNV